MICKCDSLIAAEHVLSLVQNNSKTIHFDCLAECYQNGREHGFILWGFLGDKTNTALYFANHRNSDEIVVYEGQYQMQSISEDAYRHPYYSTSHEDAAEHIIERALTLCHHEEAPNV